MFSYQWYFSGLYGVFKQKPKREYLLIIGSVGLLLTHTVITMYVAIICFFYGITKIRALKKKKVMKKILLSIVWIILMSSFFLVPLLEHKQVAQYEVFKPGRMERTEVLVAFKLNFVELFITTPNSRMIYEIGWISIFLLIVSPIVIKKLRTKWKHTDFYHFYCFSLIVGIICILMTLNLFPFEYLPAILKMLQFPFRLLEFSSFFFAFVVAVNFSRLVKKFTYRDVGIILLLFMLLSCFFIPHLQYSDSLNESRLIQTVPVTNKTGRVHAGCASFEYLPSKAYENREYIETRNQEVKVLKGNVQIKEQKKENLNLSCKLLAGIEETELELPYIYYLGYEVTLEQNGEKRKLEIKETQNGFIGVTIPEVEEGVLAVHYEGTKGMKITSSISILATLLLILRFFQKK